MSIEFISFQGKGNVTGSKHFLKVNDQYVLLDYGIWQGKQDIEARNIEYKCPIDINKISAVLLSHAHADHCALLPLLIKEGYKGSIYCTSATRDLSSVILMDSAKISNYYTEKDVIETLDHFRSHAYGKKKIINENINYTAYNAGHILGSSFMSIELMQKQKLLFKLFKRKQKVINVLYTGDLGRKKNPIVNPPSLDFPAPDYIILEATYGNRLHSDLEYSLEELANIINTTIKNNGKIIIPTFAVERAQEIIYYLKVLMQQHKIPRIPVYIDSPMATTATGVFQIHPECFNETIKSRFVAKNKNPFSLQSLRVVKDSKESLRLAKSKEPAIVIAANGMCTAGKILTHLTYGLENYKNTILLVGYTAEGSLARRLLEGANCVIINGKELMVKANVVNTNAFSAHADYKETLDWISKINTSKLKRVFLVHGNDQSLQDMKNRLESYGFEGKVNVVEENRVYNLL